MTFTAKSFASVACLALILSLWAQPATAGDGPPEQLERLLDDAWQFRLRENPLFATRVGDARYNDKLPGVTVGDYRRRFAAEREFHSRWRKIDRDGLSRREQISYDIFGRLKKDQIAEYEFQSHLMPITNRSGFHVQFAELFRNVPLKTVRDYENYIARLGAFRAYARQHIGLMRAGVEAGMVLPAVVLRGYEAPIKTHIVDNPTRSLLYEPLRGFPTSIDDADQQRLTAAARKAITQSVVAGYEEFLEFMTEEYVPAGRGQVGASALPRGREFYRHRVRRFTTLDLTPQEVHNTGLAEVERIGKEMRELIKRVGFDGDFAQFVEFLRTDPRFYVDDPEQLMKETSYVLKKADGKLPSLFGKLPRMPYGVRKIPDYIAPNTTTAYYSQPSGDGTRAGFYYVNVYDLKSRPLYEIEALSLHEAVPGHHLQIALQQEQTDLPAFQRFAGFTVFIEGWGLYAERLGLEMGFYQDPYQDFGRLSYEMWRACRLVVDTGMHYLGWSRRQAIDFMAEHSALTLLNITNEVDRYIAWPGQALAYKTGELRIRQLRAHAERQLGDRFDIRDFHDVVLGSGAVPLSILQENVEAYIEEAGAE